jgi:hypothetical protein
MSLKALRTGIEQKGVQFQAFIAEAARDQPEPDPKKPVGDQMVESWRDIFGSAQALGGKLSAILADVAPKMAAEYIDALGRAIGELRVRLGRIKLANPDELLKEFARINTIDLDALPKDDHKDLAKIVKRLQVENTQRLLERLEQRHLQLLDAPNVVEAQFETNVAAAGAKRLDDLKVDVPGELDGTVRFLSGPVEANATYSPTMSLGECRAVLTDYLQRFIAANGVAYLGHNRAQNYDAGNGPKPVDRDDMFDCNEYAWGRIKPEQKNKEPFEGLRFALRAAELDDFGWDKGLETLAQAFLALGDKNMALISQRAACLQSSPTVLAERAAR